MNLFFRILVAIYSLMCTLIFGIIMISPFGNKELMSVILDYLNITCYQSNRYDVAIFIVGLVFFIINIVVLTSGFKMKRSTRYICVQNENGIIRISSNSIENIALDLSKRFQGVKDAKAKVNFIDKQVEISIKLTVATDVNVPSLCKSIQERVKDSVEASMEIKVKEIGVSVEGVHAVQN
ncbi:MAG: alkaline shock response membrane anchor protein AmaP [Clostridia bacterium]|nr:alkaline shock response membrane anchor protein AmaP [Clostridia bacterium]